MLLIRRVYCLSPEFLGSMLGSKAELLYLHQQKSFFGLITASVLNIIRERYY